jgi:hypothetical protein
MELDLDLIITVIVVFFIPLVSLVVKMLIQMRQNQIKIEEIDDIIEDAKQREVRVSDLENKVGNLKVKIEEMDKMIVRVREYLLNHKDNINGLNTRKK